MTEEQPSPSALAEHYFTARQARDERTLTDILAGLEDPRARTG